MPPDNRSNYRPNHHPKYQSVHPVGYEEIIHHFQKAPCGDDSLVERLNIEQMFVLIDGILPIEACLYYQVLPLFLEGSRLNLGMVSPSDTAATEYVRRLVSYLNYSLVTRQISSEALRASLTAYLRYTDEKSKTQSLPEPSAASRRAKRLSDRENAPHTIDAASQPTLVVDGPDILDPSELNLADSSHSMDWEIDDASTITIGLFDEGILEVDREQRDQSTIGAAASEGVDVAPSSPRQPSANKEEEWGNPFVIPAKDGSDRPDAASIPFSEVSFDRDDVNDAMPDPQHHPPASDHSPPTIQVIEPENQASVLLSANDADQVHAHPSDDDASDGKSMAPAMLFADGEQPASSASSEIPTTGLLRSPISLELTTSHPTVPLEALHTLPASELLQELLVRMLERGIGRLYFEREGAIGRILWSEDGILQSIVDDLADDHFTQVLDELKHLTRLPLQVSDKPLQVELERMYQNARLLLRFRFIPTNAGEEATLQVLRGAALRFYQQQQLSKLSRDALSTAQILQGKVKAIRDRMLAAADVPGTSDQVLPALTQMIEQIEAQLDEIQQSHPSPRRP